MARYSSALPTTADCSATTGILLPIAQEILAKGARLRFCARGESMLPFIQDSDVLTITPLFSSLPRLGEVVAFVHPDSHNFTVHRVIRARRHQYLLKGDSVRTVDGWIHLCNILGRVISVERLGKAVPFGLGAERIAIALLQRHRYACNLVQLYGRFARRKSE